MICETVVWYSRGNVFRVAYACFWRSSSSRRRVGSRGSREESVTRWQGVVVLVDDFAIRETQIYLNEYENTLQLNFHRCIHDVYGIYVTCKSLVTFQRYIFYEWNIMCLVFFLSWTYLGHGSAQSSLTRTLPVVSPVPWNGNTQLYSVVLRCSKQRRHISVVSFERTSAHVPAALDNWERSPNRSFVTIIPRIITADKWKITSRSFNLLLRCLALSRSKVLDKLFFHSYNTTYSVEKCTAVRK